MEERISCRSLEEERRSSVGLIRNSKTRVKGPVSQDLKAEGMSQFRGGEEEQCRVNQEF
jgi:hypothetical protein